MTDEKSRPGQGGSQLFSTSHSTSGLDFLNWLFGQERDDLISICAFSKPDRSSYATFRSNAEAFAHAQAIEANWEGTYFRFTTLPLDFSGKRGKNDDSAYAYCLHADMDLKGAGHVGGNYPETEEDLHCLLEKAGLPQPSVWLHSGGGRNPIWKFNERVPASEVADLVKDWARHLQGWHKALGWKMDGTFDLSRVAGMPGTHNRKAGRNGDHPERYVQTLTNVTFEVDALRAILAEAPQPPAVAKEEKPEPKEDFKEPAAAAYGDYAFNESTAAIYMERAHAKFVERYEIGSVYQAMYGWLITCRRFEKAFPGFGKDFSIKALKTAALDNGWDELDAEDVKKIKRIWGYWDRGEVDNRWEATRVDGDVPLVDLEEEEPPADPWQPKDISAVLSGNRTRVVPTLGRRQDGARVIYAGKEHSISSEPECGKTWWVLLQVLDVLNEGGRVVYIDFEDDENTIVGRLLDMGCAPSHLTIQRFRYLNPDTAPPQNAIKALCTFPEGSADLLILDGVTEGMGTMGLDPLSQKDIVKWRAVAKEAMHCGTAVLSTDHETKNKETRGRYAIGGQHKLAGLNGVMFKMENVTPFSKEGGRTKVYFSKDRNGGLRDICPGANSEGLTHFGDLVLKDGLWNFYPPKGEDADPTWPSEHGKSIKLILPFLAEKPGQSGNAIEAKVGGTASKVARALTWLVVEEYVHVEAGPNRAKLHSLTLKGLSAMAEKLRPEEPQ